MTGKPLLQLSGIVRSFDSGGEPIDVLKGIDLTIHSGEMIAIVGASGSGKSTLMNIIGCLDKPSKGQYLVGGKDVATMSPDELAHLRREYFGFIFQRYHLLGDLTAAENVAIPAIYAGVPAHKRIERAKQLLTRIGLGERVDYRPNQLSGGQQQRVSISRALMNGGEVILADEPTGALDSVSGKEVMKILRELNDDGHTIIIVTHDMNVANNAKRIIEIKDGNIIADRQTEHADKEQDRLPERKRERANPIDRLRESFKMATRAIIGHKMRSFLTMLGIIIGIASVVLVVALGNGMQKSVLAEISAMGTNVLDIYPGAPGQRNPWRVRTLKVADANVLAQQSFVKGVTPGVQRGGVTVKYGNLSAEGSVRGVGEEYFDVVGLKLSSGSLFGKKEVDTYATGAIVDQNTLKNLFPNDTVRSVLGRTIIINNMPATIIGVAEDNNTAFNNANNVTVWLPYTTVMNRLLGQSHISYITVRLDDSIPSTAAENIVSNILEQRHGTIDFTIMNSDSIRQTMENVTNSMKYLISAIAVISLIVGGIGVMNIMLVSVTERTQEIGVRMAIGARSGDILQQFLIEAALICLIGGLIGILLALGIGYVLPKVSKEIVLSFSLFSMIGAFITATAIGIIFGYMPAKNAAKLDPVAALSRE
ncbi:MAG: MacB family efflux pump subunit [Neisseriaceae bacterium]|nr:MacB family efflux pump subunit [Neisseriaceae bacterium]